MLLKIWKHVVVINDVTLVLCYIDLNVDRNRQYYKEE